MMNDELKSTSRCIRLVDQLVNSTMPRHQETGPGSRRSGRQCQRLALGLAMFVLGLPAVASAGECTATSGARRVPLLELYTSEGCDSCPPADRWIASLPSRGLTSDRVVTLAFHVDYWNYLGWTDP